MGRRADSPRRVARPPARADELRRDSTAIEKAFLRLRELRDVLPHVVKLQQFASSAAEASRRIEKLKGERAAAETSRASLEHELKATRDKRKSLQTTLADDERKRGDAEARLRDLTAAVNLLESVEKQEQAIHAFDDEIKRLPANPAEAVRKAQAALDRHHELSRVLPQLDRYAATRDELRSCRSRLAELEQRQKKIKLDGEQARDKSKEVRERAEEATKSREAADAEATSAATLRDQARKSLDDFVTNEGKKVCRYCGQARRRATSPPKSHAAARNSPKPTARRPKRTRPRPRPSAASAKPATSPAGRTNC